MCVALPNWLNSEGIQIQVTTSKVGISDEGRFHKTVTDIKNRYTKFDFISYIYNLKTKHNATNRIPAIYYIYMYLCMQKVPNIIRKNEK